MPNEYEDKPWYANNFHTDKPNSKNMLKIFIPISKICHCDGPLEMLNIENSRKVLHDKKSISDKNKIYLVGDLGDVFICKLNVCLHKASIPKKGNTTDLMMLQLNPSDIWCKSSNLYKRQYKKEPKFTYLFNLFDDIKIPL